MHVFTQSLDTALNGAAACPRVCVCISVRVCVCLFTSVSHFHSAGDESVQLYLNSCRIFSGIRDTLYIHEAPGSTHIHTFTLTQTHALNSVCCRYVIGHIIPEQGTLNP